MLKPKLITINCPYCNDEYEYIIEDKEENILCLECFRAINVTYSVNEINLEIINDNIDGINFYRKNIYKFILLYAYKNRSEGINIKDFIYKISFNEEIINIVLDVLSRMLYSEKQLIFLNKSKEKSNLYIFGYTQKDVEEDKEGGLINLSIEKKKFLDEVFAKRTLKNFNERFY